ncbi:LytR/AlgR family response regulator transcription factor [Clostridium sp. Marseille-P2415]|uniref:LytR/AlgR family response regulator transcription factor n=1 Tax=Clostridium sp. Marseille-P2415 TaxID=1805471 RepID=UPI0009885C6E|nr:LytTR family DNA-binding domain-containing protein [Clostridium sp. Marseille-P2415]
MIKIAIVEDENEYVQTLKGYLVRYEAEHSLNFQIEVFPDGLDIVSDYTASYDIILLDIQMKHLNGMQTAEKIRKLDEDVIFIFITSSSRFAIEGYTVDALGYVLKPVPYLSFSQILSKAVRRIQKKQEIHSINIDTDGGTMRFNTDSIYYIESQLHHILIHTEKGELMASGPLKRMEEALKPLGFAKCHNAYLVNLKHVTGSLPNYVLLFSGEQIPVSRARKKAFMDCLADYLGG